MLIWLHQFYVNMSKTITWHSFFRACEMIFPVVFSENKPSRLWRCLRLFQVLFKTGFILNFKDFFLCLFLVAALKLMIKKINQIFRIYCSEISLKCVRLGWYCLNATRDMCILSKQTNWGEFSKHQKKSVLNVDD